MVADMIEDGGQTASLPLAGVGPDPQGRLAKILDSDLFFSFSRSPATVGAAIITGVIILCAIFAPWIAPHNPFDPATLNLSDAFLPPAWVEGGRLTYLLGTDGQGRDILSTILFGSRISLLVGFLWLRYRKSTPLVHGLLAMTLIQIGLGIWTLLMVVPLWVALAHQAGALALFTMAVGFAHLARRR